MLLLRTCEVSVISDLTLGEGCRVFDASEVYSDLTTEHIKMFLSNVPAAVTAFGRFLFLHYFIGFETTYLLKVYSETIKRLPSSTPSSSSSSASEKQKMERSSSSTTPSSENQVSILTTPPPGSRRIPIYEKPWGTPAGLNNDATFICHFDISTSTGYSTFARILQNSCPSFDNNNVMPTLAHVSWAWYPAYLTSDYYTPNDEVLGPVILPWLNFCAQLGYIVMRRRPPFYPEMPLQVLVQGGQLLHKLPIVKTKVRLSFLHFKRSVYFYYMAFSGQEPDDPNGNYPPVPWLGGRTNYFGSVFAPIPDPSNGDVADDHTNPIEIEEEPEFWDEWSQNPPTPAIMDGISPADWRNFVGRLHAIKVILE